MGEVTIKYLVSRCLPALDSSLECCMTGNTFCFHRGVSAIWLNKCFPVPRYKTFLYQCCGFSPFFSCGPGMKSVAAVVAPLNA